MLCMITLNTAMAILYDYLFSLNKGIMQALAVSLAHRAQRLWTDHRHVGHVGSVLCSMG